MAFLEIDGLKKRFGNVEILKGIDVELEKGGFLVLVGPSGCGKSTLLNTIAGLEQITEGEIRVDGRAINDLHPSKRDIAMVFQSYALYPNMTVAGNISFGMEMRGVPADERQKAIDKVAKVLQIGHLLQRKPSQLSGGQRQRVAMGRALVRDPKLFLFDEPLSNLDAKLRVDMRIEIKRLHATTGTTIVYVTHDQIEAMTLATKIAVMRDGEVQQFGTPAEIYNNPTNLFVADFMGSPAMNLIPATIATSGNALSVVLQREAREPITLPMANAPAGLSAFQGKPIIFGVRPEALTDPEGAERNASNIATADLHIEVVEPAGSDTFAVTNLGGKGVVARLRADANIQPGTSTPLAFNLTKAVFFDPATENRIR
ncbi:sugar ABC transporter ATP-binding protein [Mesorhizobium sp. SEMIA 3007]|uniref:ABC transporter ATP-binding protein n=2 Tax=Mesorhizobium TaxID=68287 RepID=A0A6M7TBZ6_9HYPH|nr:MULTISPECIES: ABC transporter ATP-binding protein [Mesorhizobium]AID32365.1 sn-glycerol-3-phosphate ABC transporter ATP-binding protein UgpC [Mesorhizobium huakuii 7653R]ANN57007.1 sugar ABC transporter ATP-binding protein [Mesorhizobium loti NZP2037]MCH4555168.1 ABC transporter ATP-binding protein [Mesorhizobium jarvisii]OBQ76066.1 sugar ABC transporter ATP-binding protein [Mesorhizobium loti]ODA97047.1 sugar ABC transporter ATP-binding protein [Mesorhizobium sp. SEMIA 3007]